MCGIAGYFLINRYGDGFDTVLRMTRAIAHRGPDDEGLVLTDPDRNLATDLLTRESAEGAERQQPIRADVIRHHRIAFGHRRFSIVDLSPGGHQPFWSTDRRVCVAVNGEIYNYIELRRELDALGHAFRTNSDTEVLVEAYRKWGTECFSHLAGFWAISLYDADRRALLLARDRIGKAPLYVARADDALWWCSEIKGILAALGGSAFPVRPRAVSDFLLHGRRDLFHQTFYEGIDSFPAACFAWVKPDGSFEPQRYWNLPKHRRQTSDVSTNEAATELRARLRESVRIRLRADVPVGIELSGGLDSASLVALAATQGHAVRAFTVSFPGTDADEQWYAEQTVQRYGLGAQQTVIHPPLTDFFDSADEFVGLMDEPFHSPNLLTNQRIWRTMADQGIRVSLNGAAGDEVLAGYPGIYHVPLLCDLLRHGRLRQLHRECVHFSESPAKPWSRAYLRRLGRVARCLFRESAPKIAARVARHKVLAQMRAPVLATQCEPTPTPISQLNEVLIENMTHWQMNYWMRSGNQAYMGVPIELRAPFLDHRVVEFVFSLPLTYLIRNGWLKWILRQAVRDLLPAAVVWRKRKMGFPFPYEPWLNASKHQFFAAMGSAQCAAVDMSVLREEYGGLAQRDPMFLWRIMSVCLWWKKCVLGEPLAVSQRLAA